MKPSRRKPVPVGERFGRIVVVAAGIRVQKGSYLWRCRCDCGTEKEMQPGNVRRARSCGCVRKHGFAREGKRHPLYRTWRSMRTRCFDPRCKSFKNYGGRGITICERWADFVAFAEDMGEKPSPDHSIDRIDNDGPYSPDNCRWATKAEQARNKRKRTRHEADQAVATV